MGQAAYGSSKGGVISLTLPMARDLAWYGIRVMALAPALFETPMMRRLPDRARAQILKSAEFPARFGHPEEFAMACVSIIENEILVSGDKGSNLKERFATPTDPSSLSNLMQNGSTIRLDGATRLGKL